MKKILSLTLIAGLAMVSLPVNAASGTAGDVGSNVDPVDPKKPVDPVDPKKPTEPAVPEKTSFWNKLPGWETAKNNPKTSIGVAAATVAVWGFGYYMGAWTKFKALCGFETKESDEDDEVEA